MKESVRCPWRECCHGMSVAASEGEGCYAGDVEDPLCQTFISSESWEKWIEEQQRKAEYERRNEE